MGSRSNAPSGGQGTKPPEAEGLFLNLRYEKTHLLAHYPVSNSHSHNTLYCALMLLFQRNKPGNAPGGCQGSKNPEAEGLDKGQYPKILYS